jgi:hypothetical protein
MAWLKVLGWGLADDQGRLGLGGGRGLRQELDLFADGAA